MTSTMAGAADLTQLTATYWGLRALEDSRRRGGTTWRRYVEALQSYAEALVDQATLPPGVQEALEAALGALVKALSVPRIPARVDGAVARLRQGVDAAEVLLG